MLFFSSAMMNDLETQRKGYVLIWEPNPSLFHGFKLSTREQRKDIQDCNLTMVPRIGALHLCLPEGPANGFLRALIYLGVFGDYNRIRIRTHGPLGSVETKYQLMSYGIPVNDIPLTSSGNIKRVNFLQWMKIRKAVEAAGDINVPFHGITYPGVHDVLFRQGGSTTHSGNQEFRTILDSTCHLYNETKCKDQREKIIQQIIDCVTNEWNGRFLQLDPRGAGWWVKITDSNVLHEKIGMALYHHSRKLLAQSRQQQSKCESRSFLDAVKRRKLENDASCCSTTF
jgi:hypothetical protein